MDERTKREFEDVQHNESHAADLLSDIHGPAASCGAKGRRDERQNRR